MVLKRAKKRGDPVSYQQTNSDLDRWLCLSLPALDLGFNTECEYFFNIRLLF